MPKPEQVRKESFFTELLQLKRLCSFIKKDQWVLCGTRCHTGDFSLRTRSALSH